MKRSTDSMLRDRLEAVMTSPITAYTLAGVCTAIAVGHYFFGSTHIAVSYALAAVAGVGVGEAIRYSRKHH